MIKFISMFFIVSLFASSMILLSPSLSDEVYDNYSDYYNNDEYNNNADEKLKIHIDISNIINSSFAETRHDEPKDNKEKMNNIIDKDFIPVENIEIIQKNERHVKIYQHKKYKDLILINDSSYFTLTEPFINLPYEYNDIIENAEKQNLHCLEILKSNNQDLLIFSNTEGIFFTSQAQNGIIYSTQYKDVSIFCKNTPIIYMLYADKSGINKIDIVKSNIKYKPSEFTAENISQTEGFLKSLGIKDCDLIINSLINKDLDKNYQNNLNLTYKKDLADTGRYSKDILFVSIN